MTLQSCRNNLHRLARRVLMLAAGGMLTLPATAQDILPANSETAASVAIVLPDAPSALSLRPIATTNDVPLEQQPHPEVGLSTLPIHVVRDLGHIFISPIYLRPRDLKWLVPLAGASAAAFATDQRAVTEVVSTNPNFNQTAVNVSDGLVGGFIAAPIILFGVGHLRGDDHAKEAGILGGEAMVDAIVVDEVVKLVTFRQRPLANRGQGEFFTGGAGLDSSFVSGHSMVAWSSAAAIADQYHSKWVRLGVYAAATGVSVSRVLGQQHFPSDVLVGSAGGWLIGHYVFRAHHHWAQGFSK